MRYLISDPYDRTNLWLALGFMPLGLFFDFFDGKVARWRHKSSLMGQELDSLADLVRGASSCYTITDQTLGFLWCFSSSSSVCHRSPNACRPSHPHILRAVRFNALGPIQCDGGGASQRQDREVKVL